MRSAVRGRETGCRLPLAHPQINDQTDQLATTCRSEPSVSVNRHPGPPESRGSLAGPQPPERPGRTLSRSQPLWAAQLAADDAAVAVRRGALPRLGEGMSLRPLREQDLHAWRRGARELASGQRRGATDLEDRGMKLVERPILRDVERRAQEVGSNDPERRRELELLDAVAGHVPRARGVADRDGRVVLGSVQPSLDLESLRQLGRAERRRAEIERNERIALGKALPVDRERQHRVARVRSRIAADDLDGAVAVDVARTPELE